MRRTTIALLAALMLAGCGSGTTVTPQVGADSAAPEAEIGVQEESPTPAPVAAQLGQKLTVSSDTLGATYTLSKAETKTVDESGTKPENGVFLLVFLRVDVTKGSMFACSCELSFVEADGRVREESYSSFAKRPKLLGTDLKAGQNTDGWVVFDVKNGSVKGGRVQLKVASLFDAEYGYWQL